MGLRPQLRLLTSKRSSEASCSLLIDARNGSALYLFQKLETEELLLIG